MRGGDEKDGAPIARRPARLSYSSLLSGIEGWRAYRAPTGGEPGFQFWHFVNLRPSFWSALTCQRFSSHRLVDAGLGFDKSKPMKALTSQRTPKREP